MQTANSLVKGTVHQRAPLLREMRTVGERERRERERKREALRCARETALQAKQQGRDDKLSTSGLSSRTKPKAVPYQHMQRWSGEMRKIDIVTHRLGLPKRYRQSTQVRIKA